MSMDASRQIESLASLSRRQIAQASRDLVWRSYVSGSLILSHRAPIDFEGLVYHGKVQVAIVQSHQRQVVGYISAGGRIDPSLTQSYQLPVELRAVEPTILCLLPGNRLQLDADPARFRPRARHSVADRAHTGPTGDRLMRRALIIAVIALLVAVAWYWQAPWAFFSQLTYALASNRLAAQAYADAAWLLRASIDLNPRLAPAHNDLGYLFYSQGRLKEAQAAFEQAAAADPTLAVAQNNLGLSYLETGQVDLAGEALHQAVALNPESAIAWANLGVAEQRSGWPEEAIGAYRAALRLDPNLVSAQTNLGVVYFEQGMFSEAQRYLEMAIHSRPDLPRVRMILGAIALNQKDYDRAWRELQVAAINLPNDPSLHFYLALWHEEQGLREDAERELNYVLALQPQPELAELVRSHLVVLTQP